MSGYLNRLVMRSQTAQPSSKLRPFVRSTSPIAQQDQRLGTPGFEAIGQTDLSSSLIASEVGLDDGLAKDGFSKDSSPATPGVPSPPDLSPPNLSLPSISPKNTSSQAVSLQRKVVDASAVSPVVDAAAPGPTASPLLPLSNRFTETAFTQIDNFPDRADVTRKGQSEEALSEPFTTREIRQPPLGPATQANFSVVEAAERPQLSSASTETRPVKKTIIPTEPFSDGSVRPRPEKTDFEPVAARKTLEQQSLNPDGARARHVLSDRSNSVRSLEPTIRPRRLADDAMFETVASADGPSQSGPAVVIGRINVEVVAPPAQATAATAARPGPMTAASVSVIGPLRRGVRSNVRYSLGQW